MSLHSQVVVGGIASLAPESCARGAYMVEKDGKLFQGHFPEWTYKGWQD